MNYKDKSILIVTHEYFKGSGQELKEFLNTQGTKEVFYIAHKFFFSKETRSYYEKYENGILQKTETTKNFNLNQYALYIKDFIYTLKFAFTYKGKFDIYIGCGAFNVIPGILLKILGKTDKLVLFTIDYVMKGRFGNRIVDTLYRSLDRLAFFYSDYTWNVSERISDQRLLELGEKAKTKKQLVVPIGVPIEDAQKIVVEKKENILVYCGSLMPEFGLEIVLESMPDLIRLYPDIELRLIGKGALEEKLKTRATELKINNNVKFLGFIDSNLERERLLTLQKEATIGLAIYDDIPTSYKRFSDVTKPKEYMACGLPVVITSFISISDDVKKYNLGRVINDNREQTVQAIKELLDDDHERHAIENNIQKYIQNITWKNIYSKTFEKM